MKPFKMIWEKTDITPLIIIDEEAGYMKFEGECYCENVSAFFKETSDWLNEFLKKDFDSFTFDCEFKYFSSATVKVLLNMLICLDNSKNSKNITVNWIAENKNAIIIECGEDFKEELKNISFNLVIKD
ncbi:MAG: DUF1987 domain-containing protein [Treponema sp.]|nr:DUF1987 domain-containing protein [Treponema sp.]MCL2250791.1 DUF1987 domain-containing protein [Treponema sp.]